MKSFSAKNEQLAALLSDLAHPACEHGIPTDWLCVDNDAQAVELTFPFAIEKSSLLNAINDDAELRTWTWTIKFQVQRLANSKPDQPMKTGNVIVVSSGKGGVGKSSVSASLGIALSRMGARVGLLDADIYGPSIPTMLGQPDHKLEVKNDKFQPIQYEDLVANSIGYLVDDNDATIWRGPMASRALQQLFNDTDWGLLDYLIVDMPPGTGDIQLTMAQQLPVTGAVVVTTPQNVALKDAEKGVGMFERLEIPLIGVLENMSYFECGHCGTQSHLFGQGGGLKLAHRHAVAELGQWPLTPEFGAQLDALKKQHQLELTEIQRHTAQRVVAELYYLKSHSAKN
ncbi:MAG: chromosome partitioning ATPase [Idiomarina sp. T82-3]|uniref:Mrp/NBP35 family ATP-binding protein n=1 Tax=Idiomarina TaxID=135575 RepID=UPI000798BEE7|nr:Mrp/NBP35 family ATP-binding protein [Idiomarina sp. T82-3]KXS35769.1 MAG: chromosome partitioning ATPase [Idiomarina sp. T82-3]